MMAINVQSHASLIYRIPVYFCHFLLRMYVNSFACSRVKHALIFFYNPHFHPFVLSHLSSDTVRCYV